MDGQKEYLTEERYRRTKAIIVLLAILVALAGLLAGGALIYKGIMIRNSIDISALEAESNIEFHTHGFSQRYYEIAGLQRKAMLAIGIMAVGGFIIFVSFLSAGSIIKILFLRQVLAFHAQQIRPIAQEGAEKMAPSAGVLAREDVKGIKAGLKDDE